MAAAASSMMPPARILDLDVEVLTDSRQLEFSWTAPGEDFDQGEPQKTGPHFPISRESYSGGNFQQFLLKVKVFLPREYY